MIFFHLRVVDPREIILMLLLLTLYCSDDDTKTVFPWKKNIQGWNPFTSAKRTQTRNLALDSVHAILYGETFPIFQKFLPCITAGWKHATTSVKMKRLGYRESQ